MAERVGRPPSCTCGECPKCKTNARQREWWGRQSPEHRRRLIEARDQAVVREQQRRKLKRLREFGTPEQKAKRAAREALHTAVRYGKLHRGPCEVCGTTEDVHGHHDDYHKPLEVRWLCPVHHAAVHAEAA